MALVTAVAAYLAKSISRYCIALEVFRYWLWLCIYCVCEIEGGGGNE